VDEQVEFIDIAASSRSNALVSVGVDHETDAFVAEDLGENGIRCNAILPGPVDGERIRQVIDAKARAANKSFQAMQDEVLGNASINEFIQPQQLADLAVFLASPRGKTISGQAHAVDGDMQSLA
jgi:NAD(P)-dependent dehydrogenase (short-subunit alcohol dehydrogenase family)